MISGGARQNRRKAINGDERDVFTRWRHVYSWCRHAGATAKVKRRARQRERRTTRQRLAP